MSTLEKSEIPEHWVEVQLSEIISALESGSRPKGGVKGITEGVPSIGAEHLNSEGGFDFTNIRFVPIEFAKKMNRGKIEVNDILIVKDGATTGKVSIVNEHFPYEFACVNEHVFICRLNKNLNVHYCFFFLRSHNGQEQIMSSFHGGAQGGINSEFVHAVSIPLPPLNEQKRIVEKLDAILPKVKSTKVRLAKIPALLKKFRQSVLAAACSGKLTEDWREEYAKRTGKELPEWEEKEFFDFFVLQRGYDLVLSKLRGGDYPVVTSAGISGYHSVFKVKSPGVITGRSGSVGNVFYIENDFWPHNTTLFVKDFKGNFPKYIYYFLLGFDITNFSSSTAVPTLNRNNLRNIKVIVPPLEEQHEIVCRVEKLFALADSLEAKYKKAFARVEKLEQAILAKAFRGELVEPDPNDEPASELLKKILEEKAKLESTKNKRVNKLHSRKKQV